MAVYTGGAPARGCYTSAIYATVRRRWRWLRPVCRSSRRRADAEFPERERRRERDFQHPHGKKDDDEEREEPLLLLPSRRRTRGEERATAERERERKLIQFAVSRSLARPHPPTASPDFRRRRWRRRAMATPSVDLQPVCCCCCSALSLSLSLSLSIPAHEHRFIHADTRRAQTQLARAHQTTARIPVCVARIFGIDVVAARTPVECRAGWETGPDYPADIIRSGDAAALACTWNKCEYRFFEFYSIPV